MTDGAIARDLSRENIVDVERITAHLARKVAEEYPGDEERRCLRLIPTRDDGSSWTDPDSGLWRTYRYVEGTVSHDEVQSPAQAYQAARSFARFQAQLLDLPEPPLHDTIPDFHHTPRRMQTFRDALDRDVAGRAAGCRSEIEFVLAREELAHALITPLESGELFERATHNDTKINNVLLDVDTGEGLCIIDLDTVMPGLVHYDFGDLVRTAASTAAEDCPDLSQVDVDHELYRALARGYLDGAAEFLTPAERRTLPLAGPLITFETGLRFLTDHLEGDRYFKVHRDHHNLDRARVQFRLLQRMEENADEFAALFR